MIKDIARYYIKKWYVVLAVFILVAGGMYLYQANMFDWEHEVWIKHKMIDVICGIMSAMFAVLAMFAWSGSDDKIEGQVEE